MNKRKIIAGIALLSSVISVTLVYALTYFIIGAILQLLNINIFNNYLFLAGLIGVLIWWFSPLWIKKKLYSMEEFQQQVLKGNPGAQLVPLETYIKLIQENPVAVALPYINSDILRDANAKQTLINRLYKVQELVERFKNEYLPTDYHDIRVFIGVGMHDINAFAATVEENGIRTAIVVLYEPILAILDDEELEAVVGHELGHIFNKDVLDLTLFLATQRLMTLHSWAYVLTRIVWAITSGLIAFSIGNSIRVNRNILGFLLAIILAPIIWLFSMFLSYFIIALFVYIPIHFPLLFAQALMGYMSQDQEYQADAFGATLTKPDKLASALEKVSRYATDDSFVLAMFAGLREYNEKRGNQEGVELWEKILAATQDKNLSKQYKGAYIALGPHNAFAMNHAINYFSHTKYSFFYWAALIMLGFFTYNAFSNGSIVSGILLVLVIALYAFIIPQYVPSEFSINTHPRTDKRIAYLTSGNIELRIKKQNVHRSTMSIRSNPLDNTPAEETQIQDESEKEDNEPDFDDLFDS